MCLRGRVFGSFAKLFQLAGSGVYRNAGLCDRMLEFVGLLEAFAENLLTC